MVLTSALFLCIITVIGSVAAQPTFEGQYADILFGHIDQEYVAPRAQKVIQLLDSTHAVLSGCDDGVTWWGNILANITNNGRTMYVDFSPKGGPSSVQANLTVGGHITWSGDNFWERTSYTASFQGEFTSVFSKETLPNFPASFQSVSVEVAPFVAPNYHTTVATISSSAWPVGTVATGTIHYNTISADFSAVGGPSNIIANLTQSGDIQWLQAENMWQRALCPANCDNCDDDSNSEGHIFTQNLVLSVFSFVAMVLCVSAGALLCLYAKFRKPTDGLLSH